MYQSPFFFLRRIFTRLRVWSGIFRVTLSCWSACFFSSPVAYPFYRVFMCKENLDIDHSWEWPGMSHFHTDHYDSRALQIMFPCSFPKIIELQHRIDQNTPFHFNYCFSPSTLRVGYLCLIFPSDLPRAQKWYDERNSCGFFSLVTTTLEETGKLRFGPW